VLAAVRALRGRLSSSRGRASAHSITAMLRGRLSSSRGRASAHSITAMLQRRKEWQLFSVLHRADLPLGLAWWSLLVVRGALPALFAVAMGSLIGTVQSGGSLTPPLALVGVVFVLLQVLSPIHTAVSANLGDRTAAWLYDRLTEASVDPPGMGHLEDPRLAEQMTVARDFDLGMTGPPLSISVDFIAGGLVSLLSGLFSAALLFAYAWWAPIVLGGAWLATHWLLRESGVWRDRNTEEVRAAQQHSDYAYRLAVDPPAAKEVRLFGLAGWVLERFVTRRRRLHQLQYEATRLRERSVATSMLLVFAANALVFWSLVRGAIDGTLPLGEVVVFAQAALGTSLIAFGGLNWAVDGAAAPVAAVRAFGPKAADAGALPTGDRTAGVAPVRELRFRDVSFRYPGAARARRLRPHHPRRFVARDRRPQRRRQDDAGQAHLPPVRPGAGPDRN
jgi:ATP-binding cassette subfamily B protein